MIYLDHHAATPLCEEASVAMGEARKVAWANPSSVHRAGQAARRVLEDARTQVAKSINSDSSDIVLTSGGTEACNLGVIGLVVDACRPGWIVTTVAEHPAVAAAVAFLEGRGARVVRLGCEGGVPVPAKVLGAAIAECEAADGGRCTGNGLVAAQWVNHETGTVWPVEAYALVCRQAGVPFFVDGTQAWGKVPVDVGNLGASAVAIASHKAGGPAGAGALWVARGVQLRSQMLGGGQERGRRAGSPDPVTHAGFGAAAAVIGRRLADQPRLATLRDRMEAAGRELGGVVNGADGPRVATVTNLSFSGRTGAALVAALDLEGVCASSGAACSSGVNEPSPVLRGMYPTEGWRALSALRFSFGTETDDNTVENAIAALRKALARPPA